MLTKHYICRIPFNIKKMKNLSMLLAVATLFLASCKLGNSSKGGAPNDGQLHGVAPAGKYQLPKPPGMVYIPPGTFHMGPSVIIFAFYFALKQKVCVQIFYSLFSMISFCLFTFYFFVTMYPNCTIVDNILFVVFFESLCFLSSYTFK